ncbi:hypothetical protein [Streptomyces sp. CB00316]|uniref:hypothetical protein n=1 Tax=Streptomyces sp. CB00316 TaxID=1703932 RepID=UPI002D218AF9|nr:hypothetical protein [Streptomyces sp. CB00316]
MTTSWSWSADWTRLPAGVGEALPHGAQVESGADGDQVGGDDRTEQGGYRPGQADR